MKTTKNRKPFQRPVAMFISMLLVIGGIIGMASADEVQGPVTVRAGENLTIDGDIISTNSDALVVEASGETEGTSDASTTVYGNVTLCDVNDGITDKEYSGVLANANKGKASAVVNGNITAKCLYNNAFGLQLISRTSFQPSIQVTGMIHVEGNNSYGIGILNSGKVSLSQSMIVNANNNAYGVFAKNYTEFDDIDAKVSGDVKVSGDAAIGVIVLASNFIEKKITAEVGGNIVSEGKSISYGLNLQNNNGINSIDVNVSGGITSTLQNSQFEKPKAFGIYIYNLMAGMSSEGKMSVKVKDIISSDVGICFIRIDEKGNTCVLVKETIKAENYGVLFPYDENCMKGVESLTSSMINYPIELTAWKIETKNKPIVAVIDYFDDNISFEGDPALEKLINYIVKNEQPEAGGSFKIVDEDGNELSESFGYPVAHVGEKIYIKTNLDEGYEIVAAYNETGDGKTELSKDGDQYFLIVPSGGGVDISIKLAKKAYDVKFINEDGTELQSSMVDYGTLPVYNGENPTGSADVVCTAEFSGWDKEIVTVKGNVIYKATYKKYDEHDYQPVDGTAVAPTCTKAGKEADQKCSRCEAVITGKEIAATGHTFDQEVVDAKYLKSAADCITAAVYYKSCACGEKSTDEKDIFTSGEPAGHKWKAATGYAPKTCEICGLEEGQKVTYDPIKGQVFVWTKGSKEPFVLTIKRSQDDVNCFLHYLNTLLDGAEIKVEAKSGSTIITISAETLEKLSVGEHKITVVFDDWKADFALSIAEAPADTTPVTGDTMPVVPIAVVMVAAMAIAFAVRTKKQSAE